MAFILLESADTNFHAAIAAASPGWIIEGHGAVTITARSGNTLTVDENVTCADNAKVYFGDTATPNIGWWQGAGLY